MRSLSFLILFVFSISGKVLPCSSHVSFDPNSDHGEGISSGAMINSPTASALEKKHMAAGFIFNAQRYHKLDARTAHRLHHDAHHVHGKNREEFYHFNLAYGLFDDLQIDLDAPLVSKKSIDIESHTRQGTQDSTTGFGDMRFGTKYRFWKKGIEAAFISGIKFPSGKTSSKREDGSKFEIENQPGSGSWDADFGLALSRRFKNRVSAATSFQYFLRGTSKTQDYGDIFRASVGTSVALRKLGNYPNVSLVSELNQEWQNRDRERDGTKLIDGGGTTLWYSPGIHVDLTKWSSAFFAMPIPLYQNINGAHEALRYQILSGISVVV